MPHSHWGASPSLQSEVVGAAPSANPAWTLTEAARLGLQAIAWPRAYESGKPQLEAGFARERAMQAATKGD